MKKEKPLLSVIIPTYNEEKDIGNCIKSLEQQSHKDFEIMIIDDGSTDKTIEIIKKYPKIKLLEQNHAGPGIARNLGVKKSKGKILIFVDADMTFDKNYLKYLILPILKGEAVGTEEEIQVAKNADYNIWSKCLGKIVTGSEDKEKRKIFRAILKKKFLEMGGFNPKYGYADDQTFFLKYGIQPKISKKAVCYHDNPETLKEVYQQYRWVGASSDKRLFKIKGIKYLSPIILFALFPFSVLYFSIKKCWLQKNFRIFFPWMIIFNSVRYFGTIIGISRKIYLGKNMK